MSVEPARHRFTVDEYERMGSLGLFRPEQRLELVDGAVVDMTPIGPSHAGTVSLLSRWLTVGVGDRAIVWVQNPVRLSDLSEPQPDLMLLRVREDFYRVGHPRPNDVLLLIEVSDSTARFDREVKRPLYAAAGIAEMWIVDLEARVVEVATGQTATGYARVDEVGSGGVIVPAGFADLALPVADLALPVADLFT